MSRHCTYGLFAALLIGLAILLPASSAAAPEDRSRIVDGMSVYLGIMSTKVLLADPAKYPEHFRDGAPPSGRDMYHVLLTLFDRSSGARITDADVVMRVSPLGLAGRK